MIIPSAIVALMMSGATDVERELRLDIARYSFETGCLVGHIKACKRDSKCETEALAFCNDRALLFRDWMKNGK